MKADRRTQLKSGMKIWHALCKYIKLHVDKDLVVDSLYFGTFLKSSLLAHDQQGYAYCGGPKAIFKLIENRENVVEIVQSLLTDKLCQINFQSVAEAAGSTVETLLTTLAGIRDEVVDSVFLRKLNVQLDFSIGKLMLFNNGTIQFKSDALSVSRLDERPDEVPVLKDFEDLKPV